MVASVQRALRVFMVLALWVGVSLSAVWTPPADVAPAGAGIDHSGPWLALLDRLGDNRVCGDEEGEDATILCGGDLLLDRIADPSLLAMSRGTCTRLLEELFGTPTCDPTREVCDQFHPRGAPPPARQDSAPSSSASGALLERVLAMERDPRDRGARRPASDRLPSSVDSLIPSPPPRAPLSLA